MAFDKFVFGAVALAGAYIGMHNLGRGADDPAFAVPSQTVIDRLRGSTRLVLGTGLGALTVQAVGVDGDRVRFAISRAGARHSIVCDAVVAPAAADQSRIVTDCDVQQANGQRLPQAGAAAMKIIVAEHVAASVEGRAYAIDQVSDDVMAVVVANGPALMMRAASSAN